MTGEVCPDGIISLKRRDLKTSSVPMTRGLHRRSVVAPSPGWNTTGDSSVHTAPDVVGIPANQESYQTTLETTVMIRSIQGFPTLHNPK